MFRRMTQRGSDRPKTFDVFLSHHSEEKAFARLLKSACEKNGLRAWLDEDELRPGGTGQNDLEEGILSCQSIAVLVGVGGLGPWEREEMMAAIRLAIAQGTPVIPVLLPGYPAGEPSLPWLLGNRTWVDFRSGFDETTFKKLIWGIRGDHPRSKDGPSGDSVRVNSTSSTPVRPRGRKGYGKVSAVMLLAALVLTVGLLIIRGRGTRGKSAREMEIERLYQEVSHYADRSELKLLVHGDAEAGKTPPEFLRVESTNSFYFGHTNLYRLEIRAVLKTSELARNIARSNPSWQSAVEDLPWDEPITISVWGYRSKVRVEYREGGQWREYDFAKTDDDWENLLYTVFRVYALFAMDFAPDLKTRKLPDPRDLDLDVKHPDRTHWRETMYTSLIALTNNPGVHVMPSYTIRFTAQRRQDRFIETLAADMAEMRWIPFALRSLREGSRDASPTKDKRSVARNDFQWWILESYLQKAKISATTRHTMIDTNTAAELQLFQHQPGPGLKRVSVFDFRRSARLPAFR